MKKYGNFWTLKNAILSIWYSRHYTKESEVDMGNLKGTKITVKEYCRQFGIDIATIKLYSVAFQEYVEVNEENLKLLVLGVDAQNIFWV